MLMICTIMRMNAVMILMFLTEIHPCYKILICIK